MKRAFDLVVAATALVVLAPVLLLLGVVVAATSPGGPLFRQTRVGRHRRPFTLLKFRSRSVRPGTEDGAFDAGDRTRVTAIGRLLRKSKLDELPQLWNIVVGDMSFVGPRPEVPRWTEVHPERWERVLAVRPGITDPASLEFRDEEELLADSEDPEALYRDVILPRKLELSEEYLRRRTLWRDIVVVLGTLGALPVRPTGSRTEDPGESEA